jgi:hypothetical protein
MMEWQELFIHANEPDWPELVNEYIRAGGDVNGSHQTSGWTLLHQAAESQQYEAMRLLLDHGANPNAQDMYGSTPLHRSVDSEIDEAVQDGTALDLTGTKILLAAGADLNIVNKQGLTPEDIARRYSPVAWQLVISIAHRVSPHKMVMNQNNPLDEANKLLKQNDFSRAKAAYRDVFLHIEPTKEDLGNSYMAEQYDRLLFIRQLAETYPDSHVIRLAEADYEALLGHFDRAIQGYSGLLEEAGSAQQKARITLGRLSANCRRSIPDGDLLVADFLSLWRLDESIASSSRVKLLAVNTLVKELHSAASRDALVTLLAEPDISPAAKAVIENKLEQLRRIEALAASLGE